MSKRKQRHVGQWMDVDGEPVHVLADRNMSDETATALAELVRAARKHIAERKPDMESLKVFDQSALLDTLEHYLVWLNYQTDMNFAPEDVGWQDWMHRPARIEVMYALRDTELLEMRDVRDNRGIWTRIEYRITAAGIQYLRERRP